DRLIAERVARRAQLDWKPAWDDLTGSLPYSTDQAVDLPDEELQREVDTVATRMVQTVQSQVVTDLLRNQDRLPATAKERYRSPEAMEAMGTMDGLTGENAHTALTLAMLTLGPLPVDDGMTRFDPDPPPPPPPDTTIMDEMEQGSAMAGSDATGWDKVMDRRILLRTTLAAIGIATLFGIWVLTTDDDETPAPSTQVAAETTSSTAEPEPEPEPEPPSDFSVTSDDGNVVLEVPGGAVDPDTQLAVTVLAPEEYPEELAGARQNPGTVIYRVEPTDAVFLEPVRFTRRLPASNFEGLPADAIPFIVLVGHDADGYEQLDSGEILRDGDDIFVSGWMSRPQTVISVFEQAFLQPAGLGTSTTIGSTSEFGIQASTVSGEALDPGPDLVATASSDAGLITTTAIGPLLRLQCDIAGTDRLQTSWSTIVPTPPGDGLLGVRYASTLLPEVKPGFLFSLFVDHECVEAPEVYTAGIEFVVDHPGGVVNVQGEDFAGGASAVLIRLDISPSPGEVRVGLFLDADQDGGISRGDVMSSPQPVRITNGSDLYVVPIFDFGYYIPYFVFLDQFGELPDDPGFAPVSDALRFLRDQHTGSGAFEEAVRIPYLGDLPMIGSVFAREQAFEEETELVVFVTASLIDPES
ncbi:MAG: hypothetical protein R3246_09075, partial [Acidimicrobiia bacterium]|nr:hypothetical protein [Acidimicrobiia bacterium]